MQDIDLEVLDGVTGGARATNREDWVNSALGVRIRMSDKTAKNMPWKDFVASKAGADRRFAMDHGIKGASWRSDLRHALETDSRLAGVYLAQP